MAKHFSPNSTPLMKLDSPFPSPQFYFPSPEPTPCTLHHSAAFKRE